ncbi:MAG: hypothetical protein IKS48_04455 [Eubacterium sp.]|nr:hypothetical protein [Eubacterium sp.]
MRNERNGGKNGLMTGIIVVVIILLIAGIVCAWLFLTPGCFTRDMAVTSYFKAVSNEDIKLYKNTCYPKKWQKNYKVDGQDSSIDSVVKESLGFQSGATYGDVEFSAFEKLDKDYADRMSDIVRQVYGIDMKVSSLSKVNFTVDTEFAGEKSTTGTLTRYCYKTGGKWYFLADTEVIIQLGLE